MKKQEWSRSSNLLYNPLESISFIITEILIFVKADHDFVVISNL